VPILRLVEGAAAGATAGAEVGLAAGGTEALLFGAAAGAAGALVVGIGLAAGVLAGLLPVAPFWVVFAGAAVTSGFEGAVVGLAITGLAAVLEEAHAETTRLAITRVISREEILNFRLAYML